MKTRIPFFAAALLGTGLGEVAWAISLQAPPFAWPLLGRAEFWAGGAALALAFAAGHAAFWRSRFGCDQAGWHAAVSLFPGLAGFAWPLLAHFRLPAPHDFFLRNLEILGAFTALVPLCLAQALGLRWLWQSRALESLPAAHLARSLSILAFLVYFLAGTWVGQWNVTGDAPVYLLICQSLAVDHDVDLANNYAHHDWARFAPLEYPLHPQGANQADGRQISEHKPGLPLLLVPAYLLAGANGGRWMLALAAAAAGGLLFMFEIFLGRRRRAALVAWAVFAFTAPWWTHSQAFFTEMPSGTALLVGVAAVAGLLPRGWAFVACAALPWLHVRCLPPALALAAWAAFQPGAKPDWRHALAGLGLVAVSVLALLLFNRSWFGSMALNAAHLQNHLTLAETFQWRLLGRNAAAILLDQEYGWMVYAPVFAFCLPGLLLALRRRNRATLPLLSVAALYAGPVLLVPWWHGDMAPARYLVPLTFAGAYLAAEIAEAGRAGFAFWFSAAWSWLAGLAMAVFPWLCWSKQDGRNWALKIAGRIFGVDLASWFPSFTVPHACNTAWIALAAAALAFGALRLGRPLPKG